MVRLRFSISTQKKVIISQDSRFSGSGLKKKPSLKSEEEEDSWIILSKKLDFIKRN